jgi:hypothetical protein
LAGEDELAHSAVIAEQVLTLASCLRTTTVLAEWTSIASSPAQRPVQAGAPKAIS